MREFVRVNVKEIFEFFTVLERDIAELDETEKNITENREYSLTLKKSIHSEIQKLEFIKHNLLSLEIDVPKGLYPLESRIETNTNLIVKQSEENFEFKPKKKNKY